MEDMAKHPRLVKRGNVWYARIYVPRDIQKTFGKAEIPRSLRTSDHRQALHKLRTEIDPHYEKVFADHRTEQSRLSQPPLEELTEDQIRLIGDAYFRHLLEEDEEWRIDGFEADNDDGRERAFEDYAGDIETLGDLNRRHLATGVQSDFMKDEAREVLSWEDVDLRLSEASPSWPKVINAVLKASIRANDAKRQRNAGDVVETPAPAPAAKDRVTVTNLFEWWKMDHVAGKKTARTADEYESKTKALVKWLGHDDAMRITGEKLSDYLDHVQQERCLSLKTVGDKYLPHLKAIFRAGASRKKIPANPTEGLRRVVPKKVRTRPSGFTDAEAKVVLAAANGSLLADDKRSAENRLAARWVPWVCAYAGARVTEITQLRKQDVYQEHGVWLINITPEAGSGKTGEYRLVPIHPHLVEMGFLDFVRSRPDGPLFYQPRPGNERRGTKSSQAENVSKALCKWVTSLFDPWDARLQPNHAWRHRLKTVGRDVGIELHYLNMLQGHSDGSAAAGYGETTVKALDRELRKIPAFKVDA
jgi:integrase